MSAVERYVDDSTITGLTRYAKAYSGSGYFKDAASVEKAFVVISAGAEIGIAPFAAITGIALIQGKPVIGAGILAGLVKSHPNYDYRVRRLDDEGCTIAFFQDGEEIGESSFTIADAKRANLAGKDVWKNYPRNMLFARAISNGVAFYTPDVTTTRVYVEGELDDVPATPPRPIASARPQMVSTEATPEDGEIVVDAEVTEADPVDSKATATAPTPLEGQSSVSVTNPTARVKAMLGSLTIAELEAVKEACATLNIKPTPKAVYDAFHEHAFDRETFLVAISDAINAHAQAEREAQEQNAEARTFELSDEAKVEAAEFDAFKDAAQARWNGQQGALEAAGGFGK